MPQRRKECNLVKNDAFEEDPENYDVHEYKPKMKKGSSIQYDTNMELFVIKPS